jgi:hypothetical protein
MTLIKSWRTLAVATIVVLVLAVSGCTTRGPADGFQRIRTGWAQVDIPAGWVETGKTDDFADVIFQDALGDSPTYQISVNSRKGPAGQAVAEVTGMFQFGGLPHFNPVVPPGRDKNRDANHYTENWFTYSATDGSAYQGVAIGVSNFKGVGGNANDRTVLVVILGRNIDMALVDHIASSIVVLNTKLNTEPPPTSTP